MLLVSTAMSILVTAIFHDTYEALKIAVECFTHGVAACICTTALTLQPRWLRPDDKRYTPEEKCYVGDPFELLQSQIYGMVGRAFSSMDNTIGSMFSNLFTGGHATPGLAALEALDARVRDKCETGLNPHKHGDADKCYYARTRQICHSDELYDVFAKLENGAFNVQSKTPVRERNTLNGMLNNINLFKEPTSLCYAKEEINLGMIIEACCTHKPPTSLTYTTCNRLLTPLRARVPQRLQ